MENLDAQTVNFRLTTYRSLYIARRDRGSKSATYQVTRGWACRVPFRLARPARFAVIVVCLI